LADTRNRRICLITGAARGIGAAATRAVAARGYAVCVNFRTAAAEATALVAEIERGGGRAFAHRADVGREDEVEAMFAEIDRVLGRVTALVNNAGISGTRKALGAVSARELRDILNVNVAGTYFCIQAAAARMAKSRGGGGGAIVNVSSIAARTGGTRLSPYAASKAAIEGLTVALANELASEGIRVNAVAPGVIATGLQPLEDREWRARTEAAIPLGRIGTPDEVAEAIVWLLSESASYVTGAVMPVGAGR
jgi:NAD(P)-dependent dehydrogenase (short-subunit alcohol dehydrogenase family)